MVRMIIFLIIAAFVPLVLYREVANAFMHNPGLNGLIVGVLVVGIAMAMRNVVGLIPEIRWVNSFRRRETNLDQAPPRLVAPMATLLARPPRHRRALHLDLALDPQFDPDASRREPRDGPLPRRPARLPRPARHLLGPRHDRRLGRRDDPVAERRLRRHRHHLRGSEGRTRGAALGHGHRLLVLAVRPLRLAHPRLPRSPGGPGAEPVLHRP